MYEYIWRQIYIYTYINKYIDIYTHITTVQRVVRGHRARLRCLDAYSRAPPPEPRNYVCI